MKMLSLKNSGELTLYKLNDNIKSYIFKNSFSGFETDDEKIIRGTCCSCKEQFCISYKEEELSSDKFKAFPKNTSNRVCPTNAISINSKGLAIIDENICIKCGLCLHRCPFAAIQLNILENSCKVNHYKSNNFEVTNQASQSKQISSFKKLSRKIEYEKIPESFSTCYNEILTKLQDKISDISEIIVRNTLLNLGSRCNVNAQGNVHIRVEFFSELKDYIIIGESDIKNSDTLTVIRRILDDTAVMANRYNYDLKKLLQLSVLNGLPNKRTDYYEVIEDISKVLGIKIHTMTFHILYVLNLFQIRLTKEIIEMFFIDKINNDLSVPMKSLIKNISKIDDNINSIYYKISK